MKAVWSDVAKKDNAAPESKMKEIKKENDPDSDATESSEMQGVVT